MREHRINAFTVRDSDHFQCLDRARFDFLFALSFSVVQFNNFVDLVADPEDRVQGCHRFLEDHGDGVSSQFLHALLSDLRDIICFVAQIETDMSGHDLSLRPLQELHQ